MQYALTKAPREDGVDSAPEAPQQKLVVSGEQP